MATPEGPLSAADLTEMNTQLVKLDDAERLIDQAVRGGIPMDPQKDQVRSLRTQITKLKQSFFPGQ